jgi:hypothetical protein
MPATYLRLNPKPYSAARARVPARCFRQSGVILRAGLYRGRRSAADARLLPAPALLDLLAGDAVNRPGKIGHLIGQNTWTQPRFASKMSENGLREIGQIGARER